MVIFLTLAMNFNVFEISTEHQQTEWFLFIFGSRIEKYNYHYLQQ